MPSSSRVRVEELQGDAAEQAFVDAEHERSLSFAAPKSLIRSSSPTEIDREIRRAPIAVGPGRAAIVVSAVQGGGLLGGMSEFPVQLSKVQAPPLRDETLARERLLDWLSAKIHDRVVLVIAEAGYGKTTLLADFSRRTRLHSFWYRLDRGDRDWVGFIAHLVAAVRVHVPAFGESTDALLRETATTAPPLDTVLDTFLRELARLPADPSVLILDDFHLVDDTAEIRHIVKELLARAPERLTFVFASRRLPPVPLARLRALGEVAELLTDDLRFDAAETDRLFRETYEMPLEPGLIGELSRRTEGWAASLQLVRAALHDRDAVQVRAFIGSLSGAEGHLYDYLAEEVIGDLPAPLQDFLMRSSILETIDLDLGPIAAGVPVETAKALIEDAERLGLLSRRGRQGGQARAHPLVREFLRARLKRRMDPVRMSAIHRQVAQAAADSDWRVAAHHFAAAGDEDRAHEIISSSIEQILASGAYETAQGLLGSLRDRRPDSSGLILASRVAILRADQGSGLALAEQALAADPTSRIAALNLISARTFAGDVAGAVSAAEGLEETGADWLSRLARAFRLVVETSTSGSIPRAIREIEELQSILEISPNDQFAGVANLNLANLRIAVADPAGALAAAERAIEKLEPSAGIELRSARLYRAIALGVLGDLQQAHDEFRIARTGTAPGQRLEVIMNAAEVEVAVGDEREARRLFGEIDEDLDAAVDIGHPLLLVRALWHLRVGNVAAAAADLRRVQPNVPRSTVAFEARRRVAEAMLLLAGGKPVDARVAAVGARSLANHQGATVWERTAALLEALCEPGGSLDDEISKASAVEPSILSALAEFLLDRGNDLGERSRELVTREARRRPSRWLPALRRAVDGPKDLNAKQIAAGLLEVLGELEDVRRLRLFGRAHRLGGTAGRALARRLAPRVIVEDLGRVRIQVGARIVEGSEVRRKVLALLCLLVSRERFSATREEVLESLWPDLDPSSALNSLNQTVYFLRRVFEPNFREDESPGYLRLDGETMWLDADLLDSASRRCRDLIRVVSRQLDPALVAELADLYRGKFALDFAYEEWAAAYRDNLHAAYLRVIEQAIRLDSNAGQYTRAIAIAEQAASVEPESEEVQVALIKLYRLAGAFAAASEQYGHYSSSLKAIGVEVPALDVILGDSGSIGTPAY
jgi:DNA-binding SARP family transcriptional activator/tetratricopeptide (TPR) repeat protein